MAGLIDLRRRQMATLKRQEHRQGGQKDRGRILQVGQRRVTDKVYSVIESMANDAIKGMTKYQIKQKFLKGGYPNTENLSNLNVAFSRMWNDMEGYFYLDIESSKEALRGKLFQQYSDLYKQARDKEQLKTAKDVLDSIAKLTGAAAPDNQTNIQVNADKEGITINFGFNDDKE